MDIHTNESPVPVNQAIVRKRSKIHKFLSRPLLQVLVVVIGVLTTTVTAYGLFSGQGIFFLGTNAQSATKTLALRPGEQGLVTCAQTMRLSWADPLTRRQLRASCLGGATASPAPQTPPPSVPPVTSVPSAVPTSTPHTMPPATPGSTPTSHGGGSGTAHAFGIWSPSKWDTCPKSLHDSYHVIAPDGKKYPTWHPPVVNDPATGRPCSFGHEHGRNPSESKLWSMIQEHFYYDANRNNQMDANEKAVTGIPFGYANEQLDVYWAAKGVSAMRHEDHVGHKVEFMDDFAVRQPGINGGPQRVTSIRCEVLSKVHQGVSSPDAFVNNLHEVMYFARCNDGNEVKLTVMGKFGPPGQMESICDINGSRNLSFMNTGVTSTNASYPGTFDDGSRQIITNECIDKAFLVPANGTRFSNNPYEPWPVNPTIRTAQGRTILSGLNQLFDVENAARYFDARKPNRIAYFVDLCYLQPNGTKYRGILCDTSTDYGRITGLTYDDPRSAFDGTNRGAYMKAPNIYNQGGQTFWYTDPFGLNASESPFPGSIRQFVAPKTIDYPKTLGGSIDPTVVNRHHDGGYLNGKKTVHAPN